MVYHLKHTTTCCLNHITNFFYRLNHITTIVFNIRCIRICAWPQWILIEMHNMFEFVIAFAPAPTSYTYCLLTLDKASVSDHIAYRRSLSPLITTPSKTWTLPVLPPACVGSLVHSFTRSFVHTFVRSLGRSFVHSFTRSFVHSYLIS